MPEPISVDDCLADILSRLRPAAAYPHLLLDAVGLTMDRDLAAPKAIPAVDCASIDGYAVRAIDTQPGAGGAAVVLGVIAEAAAGQPTAAVVVPGSCVGVSAGAPIPRGADAVVARDDTDGGVREVRVHAAAYTGQFIKRAGDDVSHGATVLAHGQIVGPRHIGLLASLGVEEVTVMPRPRVVVISAGAELVEPGRRPGEGEVHDTNSYLLSATVRSLGGISYRVRVPSNDPAAFAEVLDDQLVRADLVVVTGGRSDVARAALARESGVRFYDVAMHPASDLGYGILGQDRTPIFLLPSGPVAAYAAFTVFVEPVLRRLAGRQPTSRPLFRARLESDLRSVLGKRHYVFGVYTADAQGARIRPLGGPGDQWPADLAEANALIVVREETASIKAGEPVPIILLDRDY